MKKKINTKHKKNWNRLVQIIHTIYLDFMQEKNKQQLQPTILCTLPKQTNNYLYNTKNHSIIF